MEKHKPSAVPETEEEITVFSLKNLLIRIICIAGLAFAVKTLFGRGQMLFAAVITLCLAAFFFSLVMYLVRVFKGKHGS